MKLCSKLSALGALLVFAAAFASADTINRVSIGSDVEGLYAVYTPTNAPSTNDALFKGDPGASAPWTHEGSNSNWVSFDSNSGPTGGETISDDGVNTLTFVVQQKGSDYQGPDFFGSITSMSEPNTLVLFGTGLLCSAGAMFRKMRS